jgi:hypothetical protein
MMADGPENSISTLFGAGIVSIPRVCVGPSGNRVP